MTPSSALLEKHFQEQVLDLAELYRWRSYHPYDSRRSAPGFPDLVLVRDVELLFVELKTSTGRLSLEQEQWIRDLEGVAAAVAAASELAAEFLRCPPRVETHIWRPDDWDLIHARLRARSTTERLAA